MFQVLRQSFRQLARRLRDKRLQSDERTSAPEDFAPIQEPERLLRGARILFADDNEDQHFILKESLEPVGVQLTCVKDGVQALEAAESGNYDFILMDIDMPILNGYEATRELRLRNYKGPILAITGYIFPDELEKCRSAGFSDHLCKPFNLDTLYETLARYIKK